MYEAFYGLREKPFNLTPDPKYLYLSDKHKEAFAHLLFGIKNRSGFVMLTGEIGTGKTTICRNLLNQLDSDTEVAFIFNPFLSPVELLRKINSEFGIDTRADNLLGLTEELNIHLLNAGARGKNCVLVIDEAQNLDPVVLEQIRLLSNLETETNKLLQIVLIGQPELGEKLALHELRQLNQRITARYHLKPLNAKETLQYIAYRLHVAGGRKGGVSFAKNAIAAVYKFSKGTPRVINAVCDRALLIGYTREERTITAAIVRQAVREVRGERVTVKRPRDWFHWRRMLPSSSFVLAVLVVFLIVRHLTAPIEQATRELGAFNRVLSGEAPAAPDPASTANAAAPAGAGAPADQSLVARNVIDRLAGVARGSRAGEDPAQALAQIAAVSAEQSRDYGLAAVLEKWGLPAPAAPPASDEAAAVSAALAGAGLACETLHPVTEQLLAINMPGLVRLRLEGGLRWAGLIGAGEDALVLAVAPGVHVSLSRFAFREIYANEALFPWKDPAPEQTVLQPGARGRHVASLKDMLRTLRLIPDANTGDVYDSDTASAVAGVQAESGLKMDGKAGKQVRMVLMAWTAANGAPSLRPRAVTAEAAAAESTTTPAPAPATVSKRTDAPAKEATAFPIITPSSAPPVPEQTTAPETPAPQEPPTPESPAPPETPAPAPEPVPAETPPPAAASDQDDRRAGGETLVEVKELPSPFQESLPPAPLNAGEKTQTEPVAGSLILIPRRHAPA